MHNAWYIIAWHYISCTLSLSFFMRKKTFLGLPNISLLLDTWKYSAMISFILAWTFFCIKIYIILCYLCHQFYFLWTFTCHFSTTANSSEIREALKNGDIQRTIQEIDTTDEPEHVNTHIRETTVKLLPYSWTPFDFSIRCCLLLSVCLFNYYCSCWLKQWKDKFFVILQKRYLTPFMCSMKSSIWSCCTAEMVLFK